MISATYPLRRAAAFARLGARAAASRALFRLHTPIALLVALLQRTPVDRVATAAEETIAHAPLSMWLQSAFTVAASLGAIDSMAGATALVATTDSPLAVTVGNSVTVGFTVSNTINIGSWKITGAIPPGLTLSAREGGNSLNGPGTLDATTPGMPDGYGGTTGGNSTTTPILSGTPTQAGNYTFTLQAFEFGSLSGLASNTFNYSVNVTSAVTTSAPSFTAQPQSASAAAGGSVTLTVTVSGSPTPTLQWMKNGTAINGATSTSLTLSNVQSSDAANYTVVATNSAGSATSSAATVTVSAAGTAPTIATQPIPIIISVGSTATFTVVAAGSPAPTIQWTKNGTAISGATSATLTIPNAQTSDTATYAAIATNSAGTATSSSAQLTVNPVPTSALTAWMTNLSVRANMSAGQTMIVGLTVTGGAENILVRGGGPALAKIGLPLSVDMVDPNLALYPPGASAPTLTNDNWDPSLANTFASVGAYPFDVGSKDSAFVQNMQAGNTIWAQGTGPGNVLVEAYALGSGSSPRLSNISARNHVGTGGDILIAGFFVTGSGTRRLLIRGVGPRLAELFGLGGTLADPLLEIYNSNNVKIAVNDNWDSSLTTTFNQVGAFGLTPGSKDAAIVVDLPAGTSYTAQVKGADGGTGEALVEVYEVPVP